MCYSKSGTIHFGPTPHHPAWAYSCPAEAPDGTSLWHSFEMDWNTGHAIMLCPEHRETHQTSKLWLRTNPTHKMMVDWDCCRTGACR